MKGKHKKRERLGRGEFQFRKGFNVNRMEPGLNLDGPKMEQMHRQARFRDALFAVEPTAMEALKSILAELSNDRDEDGLPVVPQPKVADWCARFNLNAPWCTEFAEQQVLALWLESQPDGAKYSAEALKERAAAQELAAQPFQEHRLRVEFGFWPLTMMTRREFRDECERVLEIKFKDFCDQIEELAVSAGMEHTREKREMDHFLWLARYQVKGQTAAEIKRFSPGIERVTTDAITKAIRALARELELPLRDHTSTEIDSEKNANPTK